MAALVGGNSSQLQMLTDGALPSQDSMGWPCKKSRFKPAGIRNGSSSSASECESQLRAAKQCACHLKPTPLRGGSQPLINRTALL